MIDRRGFLRLFGAAAAAAVLDPERLLWVPGQKTIFLPPIVLHDGLTKEFFTSASMAEFDAILKQHYRAYVSDLMMAPSELYGRILTEDA
jgi:hypothetical protein